MEFKLLESLEPALRTEVLATARRRRFDKGMVLFHEGDPGDSLHLLVKGRVAVRVGTPAGETATLTVHGVGAAFGEQALIDPVARRTATVVALELVETMVLQRTDFEELRDRHPSVDRLLIEQLAGQVRRLSDRLTEALFVGADKRVVRRMLELDELYASELVEITQEDVAAMAGTTRPTVNRVMQALAKHGAIQLGRGKFTVVDRRLLERNAR